MAYYDGLTEKAEKFDVLKKRHNFQGNYKTPEYLDTVFRGQSNGTSNPLFIHTETSLNSIHGMTRWRSTLSQFDFLATSDKKIIDHREQLKKEENDAPSWNKMQNQAMMNRTSVCEHLYHLLWKELVHEEARQIRTSNHHHHYNINTRLVRSI